MDRLDLADLLERCRAGDPLAWEAFVRQFQGRLYGLAWTYVRDRDDAADLAQEIFIRLYETRARWVPAEAFMPWMLQLARNRAVDFLRRRRVRRPIGTVSVDDGEVEAALVDESEAGPESRTAGKLRRGVVRAALRHLSALGREVLVLRDMQGLSVEETAGVLGVPVGTVKSRASRARAELAAWLLARGHGPGDL